MLQSSWKSVFLFVDGTKISGGKADFQMEVIKTTHLITLCHFLSLYAVFDHFWHFLHLLDWLSIIYKNDFSHFPTCHSRARAVPASTHCHTIFWIWARIERVFIGNPPVICAQVSLESRSSPAQAPLKVIRWIYGKMKMVGCWTLLGFGGILFIARL